MRYQSPDDEFLKQTAFIIYIISLIQKTIVISILLVFTTPQYYSGFQNAYHVHNSNMQHEMQLVTVKRLSSLYHFLLFCFIIIL